MTTLRLLALLTCCLSAAGCVGTIIDATTDAAIEVVKIPFKIGGAAIDMMKGADPDDVNRETREEPAPEPAN